MEKRMTWALMAGGLLAFAMAARADQTAFSKDLFLSRVTVDVDRNKKTKIEGGDFDDKKDRISFKAKFRNSDPNRAFNGLKYELFIFGQSMTDQKAFKLLQRTSEPFSLAPLQEFVFESPEVVTAWDNTGAIFGEKYKGWYLRVFSPTGELILVKSVISIFSKTEGLDALQVGQAYDKNMKPVPLTR